VSLCLHGILFFECIHVPQSNASVLERLPSSTRWKTDVHQSQIGFNGSEPRVVGSSWKSECMLAENPYDV